MRTSRQRWQAEVFYLANPHSHQLLERHIGDHRIAFCSGLHLGFLACFAGRGARAAVAGSGFRNYG